MKWIWCELLIALLGCIKLRDESNMLEYDLQSPTFDKFHQYFFETLIIQGLLQFWSLRPVPQLIKIKY